MLGKHHRALGAFLATLAAPVASLAAYDVDILPPVTPVSREIYDLHWGILWVCVAIFVIVFGAMFWSIIKHRRAAGAKAAQFHENTTIEVIWTIVPFVILIGMAYPATKTVLDMKDASNADMSIKVTAFQWKWEYDYQQDGVRFFSNLATPREQIEEFHGPGAKKGENYLLEVDRPMVVPTGRKVRLLITSNDVIHGWYVPQLGINQYGIPGFIKDAWFSIEKPGTYRGQCSQICGKEHAFMPIVVVAKAPEEYAAWVKEQKSQMAQSPPDILAQPPEAPALAAAGSAAPPATPAAPGASAADAAKVWALNDLRTRGEAVYAANCVACHQATGKGLPPTFPALDGSKVVTGPKANHIKLELTGKPGTAMASFAHLSDTDLAAVITYVRNAWGNKTGEAIQPAEVKAARS
ncbi:MAG TPA: cytochrome c oxidase subunit II [Usitatibacter sp.]|nr:cytochrome c oxidase subunit II [Usitatibacter sp.]